ncbi:hypothetical protein KAJ27_08390 [bacterium]|nr:hypothetical protein [bacterium]
MLIADGKVLTEKDFVKLNRIEVSTQVGVATGWGGYGFSNYVVSREKKINQEVFLFETRKGYRIMTMEDQQLFCKISRQKRSYYLSLGEMDDGFLIFIMDFFLPHNTLASILSTFDRIWFTKSFEDIGEAQTEANICSIKYGLPYVNSLRKRNFHLDCDLVKKIFENVNTGERTTHFFETEGINHNYPHLQGIRNNKKKILNLILFGDNNMSPDNSMYKHKLYLENADHFIVKKKQRYDNLNLTELGATISDYKELQTFADTLTVLDDAQIVSRYKITDGECFYSIPASNVFPGMDMPVFTGNEIVEDVIIKRKKIKVNGLGMEVSVPEYYNFIYNGVVINLV